MVQQKVVVRLERRCVSAHRAVFGVVTEKPANGVEQPGLALAKLFLYDLAFLSSITRAASFLAVGAVLLVAGFFVQKLSEQGSG